MAATVNPTFDHHSSLLAHLFTEGEDDSFSRPATPVLFTVLATPSSYDPIMTQDDVNSSRKQRKRIKNKEKRNLSKQERKEKKKLRKERKKKEVTASGDTDTTTRSSATTTLAPKQGETQRQQQTTASSMSFTKDGKQYDLAGNLITPGPPNLQTTASKDSTPASSKNVAMTTPQSSDKVGEKLSSAQPNQTTAPSTSKSPKSTTDLPVSTSATKSPGNETVDPKTFLKSIIDKLGGEDTTDVNIFILPDGKTLTKKQLERRKKRIERQLSCPRNDNKEPWKLATLMPDLEDDEDFLPTNSSAPVRLGFIPGRRVRKPRPIQNDGPRDFLAGNTRAPNTGPRFPAGPNGPFRGRRDPFNGPKGSRGPKDRGQDPNGQDDVSKQTDSQHYSKRLECHLYGTDYKSRLQQKCCLRSAKCFQSFPDDLDEFSGHQPGDNFNPAEACRHIDTALLCMSDVFKKEECRATADVVNRNLKDELTLVNKIYKDHCQGTTTAVHQTIKPTTNSPGNIGTGGQGQMTAGTTNGPPMGVFVAAGVGGLLAILLVIILVVMLRRRKRPRDGRSDEKVMFENSSNASSRYKSFTRKHSEVYAEIDDRAFANINRDNNNTTVLPNSESMTSLDGRPLPSAPGAITEDRTGYLTPRGSRERIREEPGYDELAHTPEESRSPSYDKLKLDKPETIRENEEYESHGGHEEGDCEYITPTADGPRVTTTDKPEQNYHTYFVLEKQTG